jgi:hypothetical protein
MTERDELEVVRAALREQRRDTFAPGFADRTMARWRQELASGRASAEAAWNRAISQWFGRLVPLATAAALLLAVYNVRHRTAGQTVLGALFGPSATAVASTPVASGSANTMMPLDELYGLSAFGSAGKE